MSHDTKVMNLMLKAIEEVGSLSWMKLNKGKCEALIFGGRAKVNFKDKEAVKSVEHAKYLGCNLNKHNDTTKEVRSRLKDAMITMKMMHTFWNHSNCSVRFKLTVLQAVLYSKVLFGLESAELTATALASLDVFQLKGLRKILQNQHKRGGLQQSECASQRRRTHQATEQNLP